MRKEVDFKDGVDEKQLMGLIRTVTTERVIRILGNIQKNHKLTTLEEFGIRVAIKRLKENQPTG